MVDPYAKGLLLISFLEERQQKVNLERPLITQQPSARQHILTAIGELMIRWGTYFQKIGRSNIDCGPASVALEVK